MYLQSWADGETFTVGRITYRVIGTNQVEVWGFTDNEPITIPANVNNYQVVAVTHINVYTTSITLSEGIERIGEYAFNGSSISSITLPQSLKTIEYGAFQSCKFTSIIIPDGVTSIGAYAFNSCNKLQDIYIGSGVTTIGDGAFSNVGNDAEELIIHWGDQPMTLGSGVFSGCKKLKSITIPAGITEIPDRAFSNCPALTEVTIPATVERVWALSFVGGGMRNEDIYVKRFVVEDSEEPIYCMDGGAFSMPISEGINSAYMGRNIINIRSWDNSVLTSENNFRWVNELVVGPEVTTITDCAFCFSNLTSITFCEGSKLQSIGYQAFRYSGLTSAILPNSVTTIGEHAFDHCSSLAEINIPTSLTVIPRYMLMDSGIKNLIIPATVTTLSEDALTNTTSLASITIEDSDNPLLFYSWYLSGNSPVTDLYIGRNISPNYDANTFFPNLERATVGPKVTTIPRCLFKKAQHLISVSGCENVETIVETAFKESSITSFVLPPKVTVLEREVFLDCTNLANITLHDNLTEIKGGALRGCTALTSLTIPSSVLRVGYPNDINFFGYTFAGCTGIKELIIEDSNTPLDMVEAHMAYFRDIPLKTLYLGRDIDGSNDSYRGYFYNVEEITIGNLVQNDVRSCFRDATGITDIYVPWASPIAISDNSFTSAVYENTILHVPSGKNSLYAAATGWRNFVNITSPEHVTLDITATGNGGITIGDTDVRDDTIEETVEKGGSVQILITPNDNYELESLFVNETNVTDDIVDNQYLIEAIQANTTIVATFAVKKEHITISSTGLETYCSEYDLDFSGVPGIKAYIASGYTRQTGTIILKRVTNVPAHEGLVVKGEPGTYKVPHAESSAYYANMLKGNIEPTTITSIEDKYTNYYLSDDSNDLVFYKVDDTGTMGTHSAYMQLPTILLVNETRSLRLIFTEEGEEQSVLRGDANLDGEIGMPDVMFIVNHILNGKFPDEE